MEVATIVVCTILPMKTKLIASKHLVKDQMKYLRMEVAEHVISQ